MTPIHSFRTGKSVNFISSLKSVSNKNKRCQEQCVSFLKATSATLKEFEFLASSLVSLGAQWKSLSLANRLSFLL